MTFLYCKYYAVGDCPFGTSCFYMHETNGGKSSSARYLYKSEDQAVAPSAITLWDYVKTRRVPS